MDSRENDIVIKKLLENLTNKQLTEEEHKRAMSDEFAYLDDEEDEEDESR